VYALDSRESAKTAEFTTGVGPLWERTDLPEPLAEYLDLVKAMNPSGKLRYYPGSPYVADQMTRPDDRLRLFELHPADSKILFENFKKVEAHKAEQGERARGRRVMIERGDGFHSLKALLPPPSRRALVLVDPPYEVKDDYRRVKDALEEALGRFPAGIYAIWYPVLQRMESRQFADRLKRLPAKEWLNVTLTISTPGPDGVGLHSSGMFILNPPYTLEPLLRQVLPYLVRVLGKDSGATFTIEKGTQVTGAAVNRLAPGGGPRVPVGNARRASPLSGTGSLRLPGQPAVAREPGESPAKRGAAPAGQGERAPRQAGERKEFAGRAGGERNGPGARPAGERSEGRSEAKPRTAGPRQDGGARDTRPRSDAGRGEAGRAEGAPRQSRTRNGGRRP
jgi:23S rRNA A2030 N6-methylase RlmJ